MKRDFTENAKNELLELVKEVEDEKWCGFTDWFGDRWIDMSAWFGNLDVKDYVNEITTYHKKVIDKNNTTAGDIEKIFTDVDHVSTNYFSRFTALMLNLQGYNKSIKALATTINPTAKLFTPTYVGPKLREAIQQYLIESDALEKIAGDGLSEQEAQKMNPATMQTIMDGYVDMLTKVAPNVSVGETLEIPIGPGTCVYYKNTATVNGAINLTVNNTINEQRLDFKGFSSKVKLDDNGNNYVTINTAGSMALSSSVTIGNTTYTASSGFSNWGSSVYMEYSIKTNIEGGSVTSAIGVKQSGNSNWKPLPVPVTVESPYTCQIPDIDWEEVGMVILTAVVIVGVTYLIVQTGGAAAVVLVAA